MKSVTLNVAGNEYPVVRAEIRHLNSEEMVYFETDLEESIFEQSNYLLPADILPDWFVDMAREAIHE